MSDQCYFTLKLTIHEAIGLKNVKHLSKMNPIVNCWINKNGTPTEFNQTCTHLSGGVDPVWRSYMEFLVTKNPSISTSDYLVLDIKHNGRICGERDIGHAILPLESLFNNGGGIGNRISYAVSKSGKNVGVIIVSHEIIQVPAPDVVPVQVVVEGANPSPAQVVEGGNINPPARSARASPLSYFADCLSIANNSSELVDGF